MVASGTQKFAEAMMALCYDTRAYGKLVVTPSTNCVGFYHEHRRVRASDSGPLPGKQRVVTSPLHSQILALSDSGHHPDAIAAALPVSTSTVYNVLRAHRPARPRKPRPRTSDLPSKVRYLAGHGIKPARIAFLMECSRQYVSRVLAEPRLGPPPY